MEQSRAALTLLEYPGEARSEYAQIAQWITRGRMYIHVFEVPDVVLFRSPRENPNGPLMPDVFKAKYGASALGYAMIGKTGDPDAALTLWQREADDRKGNAIEAIAHILGISADVVMRIYSASVQYKVPADKIACWLHG